MPVTFPGLPLSNKNSFWGKRIGEEFEEQIAWFFFPQRRMGVKKERRKISLCIRQGQWIVHVCECSVTQWTWIHYPVFSVNVWNWKIVSKLEYGRHVATLSGSPGNSILSGLQNHRAGADLFHAWKPPKSFCGVVHICLGLHVAERATSFKIIYDVHTETCIYYIRMKMSSVQQPSNPQRVLGRTWSLKILFSYYQMTVLLLIPLGNRGFVSQLSHWL